MSLAVTEIFYSIQGESTYAGYPCAFVRLSGCNLRCAYCDTSYAWDPGSEMTVDEIMEKVREFRVPLVEITGGEPLLQRETPQLACAFLDRGLEVLVETNGTRDVSVLDPRCVKIMDVKCPGSGHASDNDPENLSRLGPKDEIKFVISDRQDYDFARRTVALLDLEPNRLNPAHFSPVAGRLSPRDLAQWILEDRLDVRLHLQLHKVVWGEEARGK